MTRPGARRASSPILSPLRRWLSCPQATQPRDPLSLSRSRSPPANKGRQLQLEPASGGPFPSRSLFSRNSTCHTPITPRAPRTHLWQPRRQSCQIPFSLSPRRHHPATPLSMTRSCRSPSRRTRLCRRSRCPMPSTRTPRRVYRPRRSLWVTRPRALPSWTPLFTSPVRRILPSSLPRK